MLLPFLRMLLRKITPPPTPASDILASVRVSGDGVVKRVDSDRVTKSAY